MNATIICTNAACIEANSPVEECTCECGGAGHGPARHRLQELAAAKLQSRSDYRGGFTSAMLAEVNEEEF